MVKRTESALFLATITLLLALAVATVAAHDRRYASSEGARILYIRSGALIPKVALSYNAVLADVYWIRAIQTYGYDRLHPEAPHRFAMLYPLLDLTTSLDPSFMMAYRFGAIFLSEPDPGGAGNPNQAIALLQKGVQASPNKWEYYHDIGFVYYWHLHNYQKAAEWFGRGGERPGAPWWLKTYAAVMLTKGGDREASRLMWRNIAETAINGWMKQNANRHLLQLDALDQIDRLGRLVDAFERRSGRRPSGWSDLIAARVISGVPIDPAGTPYLLNAYGELRMSPQSSLYPLPTEPSASPELQTGTPAAR